MCSKEGRRIVLWMCWVVNMLVTSLYYALSFATAHNLVKSYKQLGVALLGSSEIWRAPIAAAVLGGGLLLFFNLLSCAVLASKSVNKDGPGFGYGFVAAMCVSLAFFALLCGLVLDGFRDVVRSELQEKLQLYVATIALAYLCFVVLLLFFLALVVFQSAVTAELGLPPLSAGGGIAAFPSAAAGAFRNPFAAHQAKYEAANHSAGGGGVGVGGGGGGGGGYESPQGARIPAVRVGGGGGGGGGMAAAASPMAPPAFPQAMAMPTPMPGAPLAMHQDSAI